MQGLRVTDLLQADRHGGEARLARLRDGGHLRKPKLVRAARPVHVPRKGAKDHRPQVLRHELRVLHHMRVVAQQVGAAAHCRDPRQIRKNFRISMNIYDRRCSVRQNYFLHPLSICQLHQFGF